MEHTGRSSDAHEASFWLRIEGMTCASCVGRVARALRSVPGVSRAEVNLATQAARATGSGLGDAKLLVEAVRRAGYGATVVTAEHGDELLQAGAATAEAAREQRKAIIAALVLGLPVIVLHFLEWAQSDWPASALSWSRFLQLLLVLGLLGSPAGRPILASGLRALWLRTGTMDLLITLGVVAATLSGIAGLCVAEGGGFLHFHAAAMILIFINVGRYLEARARARTTDAVALLARKVPRTARRVVAGAAEEIPLEQVREGDHIRVVGGEDLPVDGRIIEGEGSFDESMMTGESVPVDRREGDEVLAGTHVIEGLLTVEATSTGRDTSLTRIIRAVHEAQAGRTRMQRLADAVAAVFVPLVVGAAAITLVGWAVFGGHGGVATGIRSAIAVLVIACPCALGLATPTAVAVASGQAARRGILVRDAAALEAAGRLDAVVFDKTGTLTAGQFAVQEVVVAEDRGSVGREDVLRLAASAEQFSRHPLARAIVAKAREDGLRVATPSAFEQRPGLGVRAAIDGREVLAGSRRFVTEAGVDLRSVREGVERMEADGRTVAIVAADGTVVGAVGLADVVRPHAGDAVARLKREGVEVAMITGDQARTAAAVAAEIGITNVFAQVTPEGKAERVRALQAAGQRVAMVGDGTNDAPALAAADVGIAFAAGTDVANAAAHISLVSSELRLVPQAIQLARRSVRIIKQNLFWAFFYNVVAIPLAALDVVPPGYAAAAMMVSSLSVVTNSLRLQRLA